MALGSNRNDHDSDTKLVILKPEFPKDKGKPTFKIIRKENGVYAEDGSTDRFSGDLVKVEVDMLYDEKTDKGRELAAKYGNNQVVKLQVTDSKAEETYLVKFNFRMYTRAFFNSLLNLQSPENIQISLWQDKEGNVRITLRQNEEIVRWKFDKEEMPEPEIITNKRGEVIKREYGEIDEFFAEKLKAFKLPGVSETQAPTPSKAAPTKPKTTKTPAPKKEETFADDSDDEVPF